MPDIKGTLWALAICLLLVIWLLAGCRSGLDRFREHREQRREDRKQWFQDWRKHRENRQYRQDNSQEDDSHHDRQHVPWWKRKRGSDDGSQALGNHIFEYHPWSIDRLGGCAAGAL